MTTFRQNPDADLDYTRDWSDWLEPVDDTIDTSEWTVEAGLTKGSTSTTATTATVWLSGGTPGETYEVTNRITTVGGRTDSRTFEITIREAEDAL